MRKHNYTYILECRDGTYYTGWTNNLEKRLKDHNEGKGAKYTKAHKPKEIAATWAVGTKADASKLEYRIKKLLKAEKEKLILNKNELSEICGIQITVAKL